MSFRADVTLACLTALRSRPWPPSSGELELLRRAAELPVSEGAEDEPSEEPARYPRVA
ncbi:MAG TPA: hypothetical protein VGP02_03885 [Mycobacteriales bacterium]|jgi:hypothetical protein|nr:hypothetical protein [Mycobacteriales bacterium]